MFTFCGEVLFISLSSFWFFSGLFGRSYEIGRHLSGLGEKDDPSDFPYVRGSSGRCEYGDPSRFPYLGGSVNGLLSEITNKEGLKVTEIFIFKAISNTCVLNFLLHWFSIHRELRIQRLYLTFCDNDMLLTCIIDFSKMSPIKLTKISDRFFKVQTVAKRHVRSSMFTASFILVPCVKLP